MSPAPLKVRKHERHDTVVGLYPTNSSAGLVAHVYNAIGWTAGMTGTLIPTGMTLTNAHIVGNVRATMTLAQISAGVSASSAPEEECDSELAEQILKLAEKSPAAVFKSPEDLMSWLDNATK